MEEVNIEQYLKEEEWTSLTFTASSSNVQMTRESFNIDNCCFQKIVMSNSKFFESTILDTSFENCDLSNINFQKSYLGRVSFKNCKMIGADFTDASLKEVTFINCDLTYSNYSKCDRVGQIF